MTVNLSPLPHTIRAIPARWRPLPPPIFSGAPSDADRELARALWRALDPDSRRWYWRAGACAELCLTDREVAALKRPKRAKESHAER